MAQQNGKNGSKDYDRDLQAMRERWAQAKREASKPRGSFAVEAEPGTYACILEEAKFIRASKGYFMSILNFRVADGSDQDGKVIPIISSTETDDKFSWLAKNLTTCGVPMDDTDITQLPLTHEQLTVNKPQVEITVKDSADQKYRNAYLNKLLAETTAEEPEEPESSMVEQPPVKAKGRSAKVLEEAVAAAPVAPPRRGRGKAAAAAPVVVEEAVEDAEAIVEEEVAVDDGPAWEAGDDVQFTLGGKAVQGVIKSIGDDGRLMVRQDGTAKSYWVDPAKDKNLEKMATE